MKKARLGIGIFVVAMAAASFGAFAQQADLRQISRDLAVKSDADRAAAHALAAKNGWPIRGIGQDGSFFELQKIVNGFPRYYATFNTNAAISTRADSVNMAIGGGSGFVLRLWDGGKPRLTHREYVGRVTWADASPGTVQGHATHVAGTMIATGIRAGVKGMSYAATIRAFEWNNDGSEMASEAASGANLSNHSYGYLAGWYDYTSVNGYWYWYGDTAVSEVEDYNFGIYDSEAQGYDQILNAAPNYLPVVSASNDRDDTGPPPGTKHYYYDGRYGAWRFSTKTRNHDGGTAGYDCIPFGFQISKNTLTVGAVQDVLGYTGPASVVLAAFSSTGPCDDGRIKPDVVGNGIELLSSYSTNDSSYAIASGTSMASPNVCGSLGLVADYYRDTHGGTPMWASTLKALAIHTALEAGSNPGPDYLFGWGLLNTYAAYKIVNKDYLDDANGFVEQLTLNQGQTIEIGYRVYASTPELRATICWNDPAATPPPISLNPRTRMLVNDLDLRAIKGVDTHYPWRLDVYNPGSAATKADNNVDNVEQVAVATPTPGVYTIRITHKGTLNGGSQKVSLIVSGAAKNHLWHVYEDGSGDAPTITAAVEAADDGDSIFVHQGIYHEAGISVSKTLIIAGVDGAALTTVDGTGLGSGCFTFPAVSKVIWIGGFTIKNGSTTILGGGIYCSNSSVTIERCVVEHCYSPWYGGGIAVTNASPAIRNVTFRSNQADHDGGGLYLSASSSVVDSCIFHDNAVAGSGGAIAMINSTPQFGNCTVHHNSADAKGGGMYVGTGGNPALTRCVISSAAAGGGIYGETTAIGATVACCDVFGNAGGDYAGSISDRTGIDDNISTDPVFCDVGVSPPDLTISSFSPCAPALSPCAQLIGALGVGCVKGADLTIASVEFSAMQPVFGDSVRATVKIKNVGELAATHFCADYYVDVDTLPPPETTGDQRLFVDSLAAGDSIVWVTDYEKALVFKAWKGWFRVDTGDSVLEMNEANNA
ncbi:MAG: S8 family serine peptidase, partial [Candidatus Krumholzibacteria bacterium]|nr:S8 family serine peptidase [Candidatus Krumholzibacteria bacterium]